MAQDVHELYIWGTCIINLFIEPQGPQVKKQENEKDKIKIINQLTHFINEQLYINYLTTTRLQPIQRREKENINVIRLFSLSKEVILYKERKRSTFPIPRQDRDSYQKVAGSLEGGNSYQAPYKAYALYMPKGNPSLPRTQTPPFP